MSGGFQASRNHGDTPAGGCLETYDVPATNAKILAPGDAVAHLGTATAGTGVPQIVAASATGQFLGVIASVDPDYTTEQLSDTGLPASTAGSVKVSVEPNALYEVDVANGPLVVANTGLNANMVVTEASKSGGITVSNMTLNATGVATTVTLPWRIVKLLESEAGVLGDRALVRVNTNNLNAGTVGV